MSGHPGGGEQGRGRDACECVAGGDVVLPRRGLRQIEVVIIMWLCECTCLPDCLSGIKVVFVQCECVRVRVCACQPDCLSGINMET